MRTLRHALYGRYRWFVLLITIIFPLPFMEARSFIDEYTKHYERRQRIVEAAERMGMDPELLLNPGGKPGWWKHLSTKVSDLVIPDNPDKPLTQDEKALEVQRLADEVKKIHLPSRLARIDQDLKAVEKVLASIDKNGVPTPGEVMVLGAHLRSLKRAAEIDLIGQYLEDCDLDADSQALLRNVGKSLDRSFGDKMALEPINLQSTARSLMASLPEKPRDRAERRAHKPRIEPNFRAIPDPELNRIQVTEEEMRRKAPSAVAPPPSPKVQAELQRIRDERAGSLQQAHLIPPQDAESLHPSLLPFSLYDMLPSSLNAWPALLFAEMALAEEAKPGKKQKPDTAKTPAGSEKGTKEAAAVPPSGREESSAIDNVAASLDNIPSLIFNYVHDQVDFEPYFGIAKGAEGTLMEMRGSDADQAALLVELLRAAGYDAVYQYGQVDLSVRQVKELTGIDDITTAAMMLNAAGFNSGLIMQGSSIVGVRMDHVWVKAQVPYTPHRGARLGTPDTWVLMDPSIKRYRSTEGIPLEGNVTFDYNDYIDAGDSRQAPIDAFKDDVRAYLQGSGQDCSTLMEVTRSHDLLASEYPYLPGTLPVKPVGTAQEAAELTGAFIAKATIILHDPYSGDPETIQQTFDLPALYGKKLSLTYPGGGTLRTPTLSLEDVMVDSGSMQSTIGDDHNLYVRLSIPHAIGGFVVNQGYHPVTVGETRVITVTQGEVPNAIVNERIQHHASLPAGPEALTDKLFIAGLRYAQNLEDGLFWSTGLMHHRYCKYPVEGATTRYVNVEYVWGVPVGIADAEYNIDMSQISLGVFPVDGDMGVRRETFNLAGAQSSYLENAIWEEMLSEEGISAIKALTLAKSEGQSVFTVTGAEDLDAVIGNPANNINLDEAAEAEIRSAHSQGRTVLFHQEPLTLHAWTGMGAVLEDPDTGAAVYPIYGRTVTAGGSSTSGSGGGASDDLGSEPWLEGTPLGDLLAQLLALLGGGAGFTGGSTGGNDSTIQSDPVNLSNGNFLERKTDLSMAARGIPVSLSRTYNSRSAYRGPLGYGWTFNYDQHLVESPGQVLWLDGDGTEHLFTEEAGAYVSPPGKQMELTKDTAGFSMRAKDGLVTRFDLSGRLESFADPNGNVVSMAYDTNGALSSITDAAGRTVFTFTTNADGLITQITNDPEGTGGRSVFFGYTQNGDGLYDLTSVTDPLGHVWPYGYDAEHNLISRADPLGNSDRYLYDGEDRLTEHIDALGHSEVFHYNPGGNTSTRIDKNGYAWAIRYDGEGRVTSSVDPLGNEARREWDADNNLTRAVDARNGATVNTYDEQGNLLTTTNPDGTLTEYTYDPDLSRVLTTVQHNGTEILVTANTHDTHGNLMTTENPDGGVTTNTYDGYGQLLTTEDPLHHVTTMTWDDTKGTLVTQENPLGGMTTVTTDEYGRIAGFADPTGETVSVVMDAADRMASMTDPRGNETVFGYDVAGRRTTVTTPRGIATTTYDAMGRVVAQGDEMGNTTRTTYDPMGHVLTRTDAMGNETTYFYDELGRVASVTDPDENVTSFEHCANLSGGGAGCSSCGGGACVVVDALGNVTRQEIDALGRVTKLTDPLGYETSFTYDALGRRLSLTDPEDHTTSYEYDSMGRLTAVTEANEARTEYTYDLAGNKRTQTDANDHTWSFSYNALNQIETETDPLDHVTTYHYNNAGQLTSKDTPNGETITYAYEHRQLTGVTHDGITDSYSYDGLGRRIGMSNPESAISYVYDNLNRIVSQTDAIAGRTITYIYDANGHRTRMTLTAGATTEAEVNYFYDSLNRLVRQEDSRTGTFTYGYDAISRRTSLNYPNGVTAAYEYDAASHVMALLNTQPDGTVIDGYSYTYNKAGMRLSMTTEGTALGPHAGPHSYAYDPTYKLTEANYPEGRFEHFTYDNVGNRLALADERGNTTYTYNEMNQIETETRTDEGQSPILTTYGFDSKGNMISKQIGSDPATTYQWDALNRMTSLIESSGVTHSFAYDPTGIRQRMTGNGSTLRFLLAGEDIVEDLSPNGSAWDTATYYSHGPGIDEPLAQFKSTATSPGYLHHDGLSSVTAMTNSAGANVGANVYNAYGTVANDLLPASPTQVDSRYDYASRESISEPLMYNRARYYNTHAGSFISADPMNGSKGSPLTLSKYLYADANPVNFSDPLGFFAAADGLNQIKRGQLIVLLSLMLVTQMATMVFNQDWDNVTFWVRLMFVMLASIISTLLALHVPHMGWYVFWNVLISFIMYVAFIPIGTHPAYWILGLIAAMALGAVGSVAGLLAFARYEASLFALFNAAPAARPALAVVTGWLLLSALKDIVVIVIGARFF